MTFGLSVVNDAGVIVIDSDYSNYAIIQVGTLANGAALLTPNDPTELIFYRPVGNGDSASFTNFSNYWYVSGSLEFIRCIPLKVSEPVSEAYGLQVFDSIGGRVFDSSSSYVKPVGMYSYTPSAGSSSYTLPAPPGTKNLWFSSQVFKFIENIDTGMGFGEYFMTKLIRNSLTSYTLTTHSFAGPPATFSNSFQPFQFLVIEA